MVSSAEGTADVDLARALRRRAQELSFDAIGFAKADQPLQLDHERYLRFIAAGWHGQMRYLATHAALRRRLDHPGILADAKTVICLMRFYARAPQDEQQDPPLAQAIARYARGRDYHGFLRKKLRQLATFVRTRASGVEARALVDTAPVLERAWAARAGLGFIGKNGLLIVPGRGSYGVLGQVVTTLQLPEQDYGRPTAQRCGACERCLEACPTAAFVEPFVLDARRCIAYHTIEDRQPEGCEPALRAAVGEQLFGCDVCQEVCPHNQLTPPCDAAPFRPLPSWSELSLLELLSLDVEGWNKRIRGTPVRRATRLGLARNALLLAHRRLRQGDRGAAAVLEKGRQHDHPAIRKLAAELQCSPSDDPA